MPIRVPRTAIFALTRCFLRNGPGQGRVRVIPDTGIGAEMERVLSPALIVSPQYGTRASTAVVFGEDGSVSFAERTILSGGSTGPTVSLRFRLER